MVAYAIVDLIIYDIEQYLAYQQAVKPLLASVGARYLVRGGEFKVLAGDYQPDRLVLVEFPSLAVLEDFYQGEAYQALEAQRRACCSARVIGVQGLSPGPLPATGERKLPGLSPHPR